MSATDPTPPSSPRIPPVTEPTAEQAEILEKTKLAQGPPANVFATLAHNPTLLKRFNVLGGYFMSKAQLSPRLRELSILRTAHVTGCLYEFTQHRRIALERGLLDEAEIARVVTSETDGWGEQELAVIEATDELCLEPVLSPAAWDRLDELLDRSSVMDLLMLVGFYRGLAGFLNTVGVEVDETFRGGPEESWPLERSSAPVRTAP